MDLFPGLRAILRKPFAGACTRVAEDIHAYSRRLGHVPLIDINPRRNKALKEALAAENTRRKVANYQTAEDQRDNERSTVERVNGRLKRLRWTHGADARPCQGDVPPDVWDSGIDGRSAAEFCYVACPDDCGQAPRAQLFKVARCRLFVRWRQ
jgi:hypothetical protein